MYQPLQDSFLSALVSWSPFLHLKRFHLGSSPLLTLLAANTLISGCPKLEHISRVASWGGVDRDQLDMIRREVRARNLNLVID